MNKNILFPVLFGVAGIACFVAMNSNVAALKKRLTIEQYNRLDAEKQLDVTIKNARRVQEELSEAKRKLDGIQNIVSEGQSTATQLKSQVENTAKENEDLKTAVKRLQDELVASQKAMAAAQQAAVQAAQQAATQQVVVPAVSAAVPPANTPAGK